MSSGIFTKTRYAAEYGDGTNIHPIRVQPETLNLAIATVANTAPTGAITNPISAQAGTGRKRLGLHARTVTLQAPATGQPTGYAANGLTTVPLLNTAIYSQALIADSATTVSYLGVSTWRVSYVTDERVK
jgi:hypothetical protein